MSKKIKTDDLIETLQDDSIMSILEIRLTPTVDDVFKKLAADFKSSRMQLVGGMVAERVGGAIDL